MEELSDGVGLDVGSTTVKAVAVTAGVVRFREYRRHHGECERVARTLLREAEEALGGATTKFVTGSAGSGLADSLGALYVQEVHAVAATVRARHPDARTVIELGGQDAKMIHFTDSGAFTSDMNERCAAGTGATIDRCLYRIGMTSATLREIAIGDDEELPVVSAKCGVFAENDLVGLVRSGLAPDRAVAALLDAIIRGNLAVLARGRTLPPTTVLLGGPHAFIPALATLWRRHLGARWASRGLVPPRAGDVVVPEGAVYYAAEGGLRCAGPLARMLAARTGAASAEVPRARRLLRKPAGGPAKETAGLLRDGEDLGLLRHLVVDADVEVSADLGAVALGIDAGSTSIKAVLLDGAGVPRARVYRRATANPLEDVRSLLHEIAMHPLARSAPLRAIGLTGYGAELLGPVIGSDATPVETLAHAHSALRYVPDADIVCDVGGQDIKVLRLANGVVTDFRLSNQCAAGNGALLEAAAHDLGVPIERYAEVAFGARRAPVFTVGCAVFLDTERITYQRDGYTPAEILAGIAAVLPRNIWENVVAAPSIPALGRTFVLSGGVQRNAAALKAQVDYLQGRHPAARIVVHPYPGEAGAIGAALLGLEAVGDRPSRFVGFARVAAARFSTRQDEGTRCRRCPSACARTFVSVNGGTRKDSVRLVAGHGCDRGAEEGAAAIRLILPSLGSRALARNLLRIEAARLFEYPRALRVVSRAGRYLRIAMPRVLSLYRCAPFFTHYLGAIGVREENLVVGEATSAELWRAAAGRGTVDACFPAKVVQAHVAHLLANRAMRPFDLLFWPILTHALTAVVGCADTASCPVVAGTPLVTRAAFGATARGDLPEGVRLLTPTLTATNPTLFDEQLWQSIRTAVPELTLAEHRAALEEAQSGQGLFERSLEEDGAMALRRALDDRCCAILFLARPYHVDPGLHHDLGSELWAMGRTTLSIRALPKRGTALDRLGGVSAFDLREVAPYLTNSGDGEKLAALRLLARHPYLVALELSSFKCGQDASLYGAVADAARVGGRPFLALHDIDETRSPSSLRLRIRTFIGAVERYERGLSAAMPGRASLEHPPYE